MHQFWYKLEWSSAENRVSENISVEHILMWEDNWDIWSFPIYGAIEKPLRDETVLSQQHPYHAWRVSYMWRFRMVNQLLSLNSRTCFGSLLFSPVLSLTGWHKNSHWRPTLLNWCLKIVLLKWSLFLDTPMETHIRFMLKVMKISQSWWHVISVTLLSFY